MVVVVVYSSGGSGSGGSSTVLVVCVIAVKVVVNTRIRRGNVSTCLVGFAPNLTKFFHKEALLQCVPVKFTRNSSLL